MWVMSLMGARALVIAVSSSTCRWTTVALGSLLLEEEDTAAVYQSGNEQWESVQEQVD